MSCFLNWVFQKLLRYVYVNFQRRLRTGQFKFSLACVRFLDWGRSLFLSTKDFLLLNGLTFHEISFYFDDGFFCIFRVYACLHIVLSIGNYGLLFTLYVSNEEVLTSWWSACLNNKGLCYNSAISKSPANYQSGFLSSKTTEGKL